MYIHNCTYTFTHIHTRIYASHSVFWIKRKISKNTMSQYQQLPFGTMSKVATEMVGQWTKAINDWNDWRNISLWHCCFLLPHPRSWLVFSSSCDVVCLDDRYNFLKGAELLLMYDREWYTHIEGSLFQWVSKWHIFKVIYSFFFFNFGQDSFGTCSRRSSDFVWTLWRKEHPNNKTCTPGQKKKALNSPPPSPLKKKENMVSSFSFK